MYNQNIKQCAYAMSWRDVCNYILNKETVGYLNKLKKKGNIIVKLGFFQTGTNLRKYALCLTVFSLKLFMIAHQCKLSFI